MQLESEHAVHSGFLLKAAIAGSLHPILAFARPAWNAMPTHSPALLNAGPPLLPLLMAASIWTASSSVLPWAYDVTSIRLTTPGRMRVRRSVLVREFVKAMHNDRKDSCRLAELNGLRS